MVSCMKRIDMCSNQIQLDLRQLVNSRNWVLEWDVGVVRGELSELETNNRNWVAVRHLKVSLEGKVRARVKSKDNDFGWVGQLT